MANTDRTREIENILRERYAAEDRDCCCTKVAKGERWVPSAACPVHAGDLD